MMWGKARYLQNKFDNVNTIADSCFHFGYMGQKSRRRDENDKP